MAWKVVGELRMTAYFTSDLHLGHENILFHNPPRLNAFESVEEMDTRLIGAINDRVGRDDELYILGDFAWKTGRYGHYRNRIYCRKIHFIMGTMIPRRVMDSSPLARTCW